MSKYWLALNCAYCGKENEEVPYDEDFDLEFTCRFCRKRSGIEMKFETFKIEKEIKKSIMSPGHPKWKIFHDELEGPNGCNFREENGRTNWDCKGGHDQTKTRSILAKYDVDIEKSLEYFTKNGGHCDCEILFNVNFN